MPGYLLHQGAVVQCQHAGNAQPTLVIPRVRLGGQPVAVQGPPYSVAGCTFPPPPAGNGPCVTAQWVTAATRVKANGMPVLLQDSRAVCAPTGTGAMVSVTQVRVKGV